MKNLPLTDEAVELNIKQAHFVTVMWKSCTRGILPELDPSDNEWEKDGDSLRSMMLPFVSDVVPQITRRFNVQLTDVPALKQGRAVQNVEGGKIGKIWQICTAMVMTQTWNMMTNEYVDTSLWF